jgi:hypothetical protein
MVMDTRTDGPSVTKNLLDVTGPAVAPSQETARTCSSRYPSLSALRVVQGNFNMHTPEFSMHIVNMSMGRCPQFQKLLVEYSAHDTKVLSRGITCAYVSTSPVEDKMKVLGGRVSVGLQVGAAASTV